MDAHHALEPANVAQATCRVQPAGVDVPVGGHRRAGDLRPRGENAHGFAARRHLATISQTVNQGGTLSEGLAATGDFFPPLFREMVHVGEQSGHLGEVLKQLADHYQNQITLRRNFLASIAWPAIELFLAVLIVGFLIWIMGVINGTNHAHIDPLGFGLVGNGGLAKYAAFVAIVGITLALVVRAVTRGVLWTRLCSDSCCGFPRSDRPCRPSRWPAWPG